MADLEAVLADVSYLMAMEKSKSTPAARASRKITLPDPSVRSVMHKYLLKMVEVNFDKIFNQRIGFQLFKEYCSQNPDNPVQLQFYEKIREFEKLDTDDERIKLGKKIYDDFIMKELVSSAHFYSDQTVGKVQQAFTDSQKTHKLSSNIFEPYIKEICDSLRGDTFQGFLKSDKYTRFCQWKNLELNMTLSMTDFSVHRIIGRGGFGEVYGCRKADTGKMYAMKCLDKKRIKMKKGEALALNERIMLSLVSTGEGCPFIVCMTYAFQTSDKLCFVLDLMNGGDLHYHLTNNGLFKEADVRFYASEIVLGLEHMHNRNIVYRDLKPANILLDENGHVRISDLGLAYDFSQRKPHASVGTHGYMAPEVLAKDEAYDSSADWFSFGCMLYKLLNGHSPFRHHKTKDKREIDHMTMTTDVELPKTLSDNMKSLLSGLLKREVLERLGCQGRGAAEVKEHPFFEGVDWQLVYLQKYPPPLIPPRGEVNAADAFEIGSFDDEDTRTIRMADEDQQRYKDFNMVVSERWQQEVCETVFETTNQETDKRRNDRRNGTIENLTTETDCIVEGNVEKAINSTLTNWAKRYLRLYPNRLEFHFKNKDGVINPDKQPEMISMETVRDIKQDFVRVRQYESIEIILKDENTVVFTSLNREGNREDKVMITQWKDEVIQGFEEFSKKMSSINKKVSKMYGASIEDRHFSYSNSVS